MLAPNPGTTCNLLKIFILNPTFHHIIQQNIIDHGSHKPGRKCEQCSEIGNTELHSNLQLYSWARHEAGRQFIDSKQSGD